MKCVILHESSGRIRVRMAQSRMTLRQADLLEAYLERQEGVRAAKVYERTGDAVIRYTGRREGVIAALARFSYADSSLKELDTVHSSRELNRQFQDKLVGMVAGRILRRLFLPAPLRMAWAVFRAVPYLIRGVRCLLKGRLRVEVLDAISIGVSLVRGDFGTASSVMFLLRIGELPEEWTHKKSVEKLYIS